MKKTKSCKAADHRIPADTNLSRFEVSNRLPTKLEPAPDADREPAPTDAYDVRMAARQKPKKKTNAVRWGDTHPREGHTQGGERLCYNPVSHEAPDFSVPASAPVVQWSRADTTHVIAVASFQPEPGERSIFIRPSLFRAVQAMATACGCPWEGKEAIFAENNKRALAAVLEGQARIGAAFSELDSKEGRAAVAAVVKVLKRGRGLASLVKWKN